MSQYRHYSARRVGGKHLDEGLLSKLKSETFILDLAPKSPLPKLDGYQYRLVDTSTLEVEVLREQGLTASSLS